VTEVKKSARTKTIGVVLALLGLVALGYLLVERQSLRDDRALLEATAEAVAEANEIITRMTTYNHATVEEDFSWVDEVGTTQFEEDQTESAEQLIPLIKKTKAIAEGSVAESAGTASSPTEVTVLLFVDQVLSREGSEESSVDRTRVQMDMVLRDGQWLIDGIELL
jgi:Mce-associated membrane protein